MKRILLGVAALLSLSGAEATNPVLVTTPATTTVTVPVPIYGAAYSPAPGVDSEVLLQILAELKAMRAELQALKANPLQGKVAPFDTLKRNCGTCHNAKTAAEKGGELMLIDEQGKLGFLSRADRREILSRVSKGTMPPMGKLTEADKEAILSMFK